MRKLPYSPLAMACVALCVFIVLPVSAFGQGSAALKEGIEQYNKENYEEAIVILTNARTEDPSSAEAAFYLGMAYRQTNDIQNAYIQFESAVNLKPLSDNAILELIEVSTLLSKLDVANKWIAIAEEHKVYPARVAFLKGAALAKGAKYEDAIVAFEKSKQIDPAYTQSADFQIGICYMSLRKYDRAKDLFQSAITKDPVSDMATYARRYQEAAEQWRFIERPLRVTVSVTGQYDTNYQTLNNEVADLFNIEKKSLVMQNLVRLDYVPVLPGPFVFNAGYAALNTLHQRYGTDNDTFANSFSAAPGVNYESFAVNLVGNYTHNLKRGHPPTEADSSSAGYRRYSEVSSVGPLFRFLLSKNHILEASAAYTRKNYFQQVALPQLEDQSSRGLDSFISWVWLFGENALFNMKFGYTKDDAEGVNYDNQGFRTTANLIYPLGPTVRLQIGGDVYFQDYKNENILFGNEIRKDRNYTGSVGLTWSACKYADVIAQYMFTRVNSSISVYDYQRELISLGVELKF